MNAIGQIVVGVDGSAAGRRALRWAMREAGRRGDTVQAVIAWRWDTIDRAQTISSGESDEAAQTLSREVEAVKASVNNGVLISRDVIEGRPGDVLTAASRNADLLVIGSHGHSHRLQEVLGSVAEECVRNAACPVVIVPTHWDSAT